MKESGLPVPAPLSWEAKPLPSLEEAGSPSLAAYLDRLRRIEYVTGITGLTLVPALLMRNEFALRPGTPDRLEGWYSRPPRYATLRFEIQITARTADEQAAALQDLRRRLLR